MSRWSILPLGVCVVLGVIFVLLFGSAMLAGRLVPPRPRQVVRSTVSQVMAGLFSLGGGLLFGAAGLLSRAHERPGQLAPWLGLVGAFLIVALYAFAASTRERVRWDRKGITQTRLLLPARAFPWGEIDAFEPRGLALGLRAGGRRAVLCALDAEGIDGLLTAAQREGVTGVAEVKARLPRDRGNRRG